jgi:phosphohistidine phosphatase
MDAASPAEELRTIVLLRHAKSVWGLDLPDHDRPLASRGRRDALAVGQFLHTSGVRPDLVVCSTATRAQQTWKRAEKGGAEAGSVTYEAQIYEASAQDLTSVIRRTDPQARSLLIVGHAPGIPELVDYLAVRTPTNPAWRRLEVKYPTSGLAVLRFGGDWSDVGRHRAELVDFAVPRGAKK